MPGWAPANRRSNAPTVSEVMERRFLTRKLARVVAFNAAHTSRRCRPMGAVTNSRAQPPHQAPKRGTDTMGRLQQEDHTLTAFGLFQAWFALLGFQGFWGC